MEEKQNHELATSGHPHIESHHDGKETVFCLVHNEQCGVTFEIIAKPEEQAQLERALLTSVELLDTFFDGHFAEYFKGLSIQVGDNLTEGGGEACGEENRILMDRKKMLLSVSESDLLLSQTGWADEGDRLRALPKGFHDMPVAVYELVHEVGHIIEERADLHLPKNERLKRAVGLTDKSPTNLYHQDPNRPQEAFAEAFAYMVFGNKVNDELSTVVKSAIEDFKAKD